MHTERGAVHSERADWAPIIIGALMVASAIVAAVVHDFGLVR